MNRNETSLKRRHNTHLALAAICLGAFIVAAITHRPQAMVMTFVGMQVFVAAAALHKRRLMAMGEPPKDESLAERLSKKSMWFAVLTMIFLVSSFAITQSPAVGAANIAFALACGAISWRTRQAARLVDPNITKV